MMTAVDLFAGAGGWDLAAEALGIDVIGVEIDDSCIKTRDAVGFKTIHDDIRNIEPLPATGLIASPPCFPAGTPVLTDRGMTGIENVRVGDRVLTHQGRWRSVVDTMSREAEVVAHSWLATTLDHPFWTRPQIRFYEGGNRRWSLGDPDWTAAGKMHGEFIAIPIQAEELPVPDVPGWKLEVGQAFWTMLGRWLADGWVRDNGLHHEVIFGIGKHKADAFRRVLQEVGVIFQEQDMRTSIRFTFYHRHLPAWLVENFGYKSYGKTMPGWLFGASQGVRQAVLDGYLAGDGSPKPNGWSATTTSFDLAIALRVLVNSLGYTSSVMKTVNDRQAIIEGRKVSERPSYRVQIEHDTGRYTRIINGHRWVKSRKPLSPRGVETVYDITVEKDHSFVAYGYIVHNCQSYSAAGKGSGRKQLDEVLDIAHQLVSGADWWRLTKDLHDERTALVLEPLHWIFEMRKAGTPYRWITLEQVPPVLPVWEYYADLLRWMGYSAATGRLQAEQYGVAQTRKRAILIASLDRRVELPTPTHSKYYPRSPRKLDDGLLPWVSMAQALGWGATGRPGPTTTSGGTGTGGAEPFGNGARQGLRAAQEAGDWVPHETVMRSNYGTSGDPRNRGERSGDEPAPTMTSKANRNLWRLRASFSDNGYAKARDRSEDEPAQTVTGKHRSADWVPEDVEMRAAGRTSPDTAGAVPRDGNAPSATLTGKGTAVWMRQSAMARATVRHEDQPAPTITAAHDRAERVWLVNNTSQKAGVRSDDQPAPTMYFGARLNKAVWAAEHPATSPGHEVNGDDRQRLGPEEADRRFGDRAGTESIRVSVTEAAILQSFPEDFPWQGTRTSQYSQVGNAVPPLLAWHVLRAASGLEVADGYVDEQQDSVDQGFRGAGS